MTEQVAQAQAVILAQIRALEEQIKRLQETLKELVEAQQQVQAAIDSINAARESGDDILIPLDPGLNAIARARVEDKDKFIVHLGLDVYAKLPAEKALRVLEEKKEKIGKSISEVNKQLQELMSVYEQYRAYLQQLAIAQAMAAQARTEQRGRQGKAPGG